MKHLTTLLTLLLSCSMLAQGPVEFPWNPDADGDDFIGVNDLMALLGEFDSVFSEEALYLSEDSLSAMYAAGNMAYIECQIACSNLPGRWKMPKLNEVFIPNQSMWLNTSEDQMVPDGHQLKALTLNNVWGVEFSLTVDDGVPCYCFTKERPKVEYSFCDGGDPSGAGFTQCINEKLAEGWYPLSGFPVARDVQAYAWSGYQATDYIPQTHASFWRWAE